MLLLLLCAAQAIAQRELSERRVSINVDGVTVESVLTRVAEQANFRFSYNTELVPVDSVVNAHYNKETVGNIITQLFSGRVAWKTVGKHLILKPARKPKQPDKLEVAISGSVLNARTGKSLANASVYTINGKCGTVSNDQGTFELRCETDQKYLNVAVRLRSFLDTVVVVKALDQQVQIQLMPVPDNLTRLPMREAPTDAPDIPREVEELGIVKLMVPQQQRLLNINFDSFLTDIPAQVSLLPNVGTNRLVSGSVENNFSLNILAGYSYAIKGIEVGGLLNVTRTKMTGLQVAGLGNVVGERVEGVQVAGLFNNCRGSMHGVQVAGINNIVLDTIIGVQVSGFSNVLHGHMQGAQVAGFLNMATKDLDGTQVAGFLNVAKGDVHMGQAAGFMNHGHNVGGLQVAGFLNVATGNVDGVQAAGYINVADCVNAAQVAGFANIASGEVKGAQVSSFLNVANKVGGAQIGLFNFADSVGGVTVGFFSFVKKGYHEFELSSNEVVPLNASFKTGTRYFYNIFSFGTEHFRAGALSLAGYGVGSEFWLKSKRFRGNFDLTTHTVMRNWRNGPVLDLLNRATLSGGIRIGKPLVLNVGPVLNVHVTQVQDAESGQFLSVAPYRPFFSSNNGRAAVFLWVGWHAALRL